MTSNHYRIRWTWTIVIALTGLSIWLLYRSVNSHAANIIFQLTHGMHTQPANVYKKYYYEGDNQYLWATGPKVPGDDTSEWFDMTGSPIALEKINHGLGRDEIPAIDNPVFVPPDDKRLSAKWAMFIKDSCDELPVIGYVHGGIARAYPIFLLNRHELVNDTVGGKPVTIGW